MKKSLLTLIPALFFSLSAHALSRVPYVPEIGKPAIDFTAKAASGKTVKLSDYKGKVVVLEWTNPGCPFVKKFYGVGEMQKLQASAKAKGVVWLSINSSAAGKHGSLDAGGAKAFLSENNAAPTEYLLDTEGKIGHFYSAKTTPHMFVIDKDGAVAYMGAIDDKPTPHAEDIKGANNYVTAALDAVLAGKKPAVASTQSYGCNVKY